MRFIRYFGTIAITGAVLAGLSACTSDNGAVSFNSSGVTQTFGDAKSANTSAFPLPVYPNSQPKGSVEAKGEGDENSKMLMLESSDDTGKIKEFYVKSLKDAGWQVTDNSMLPSLVNLLAQKNDQEANVMISGGEAGQKTNISISVSREPAGQLKPSNAAVSTDKLNPPTD